MGKWLVTLTSGNALREAIDDEDLEQCLKCLRTCYQELHDKLPEQFTDVDLEMSLDDVDTQLDNLHNLDEYDMDEEDCEDEFNYLLDNFYDLCDNLRAWVGL